MPALSSKYNDTPEKASRPYDANRDGFIIAGGGGGAGTDMTPFFGAAPQQFMVLQTEFMLQVEVQVHIMETMQLPVGAVQDGIDKQVLLVVLMALVLI